MKLWSALYNMVWLNFLAFLIVMGPIPPSPLRTALHILVGVGILAMAFRNKAHVDRTGAPERPKRVAGVLAGMAVGQGVLGLLLLTFRRFIVIAIAADVVSLLHILVGFAMITQAASIATGYDMWEEQEIGEAPPPEKAPEPAPT